MVAHLYSLCMQDNETIVNMKIRCCNNCRCQTLTGSIRWVPGFHMGCWTPCRMHLVKQQILVFMPSAHHWEGAEAPLQNLQPSRQNFS